MLAARVGAVRSCRKQACIQQWAPTICTAAQQLVWGGGGGLGGGRAGCDARGLAGHDGYAHADKDSRQAQHTRT